MEVYGASAGRARALRVFPGVESKALRRVAKGAGREGLEAEGDAGAAKAPTAGGDP